MSEQNKLPENIQEKKIDKNSVLGKHLKAYYHRKGESISNDDILPVSRILPIMDEIYHLRDSEVEELKLDVAAYKQGANVLRSEIAEQATTIDILHKEVELHCLTIKDRDATIKELLEGMEKIKQKTKDYLNGGAFETYLLSEQLINKHKP